MRWLIGITESVDVSLSKVHEIVNDSDAWHGAIHGVTRSQTHCLTEKQFNSHHSEWLSSKNLQAINAGERMKKREPSCTVGLNANWYSHHGEQ